MNKTIYTSGAVLGFLAIALGAFGAHGLEQYIDSKALSSFETGVRYQMYHAFFLLVVGLTERLPIRKRRLVFYLAMAGVILFSGSIYLLATNALTTFECTKIALLTPLGGLFLLAAWIVLLLSAHRYYGKSFNGV